MLALKTLWGGRTWDPFLLPSSRLVSKLLPVCLVAGIQKKHRGQPPAPAWNVASAPVPRSPVSSELNKWLNTSGTEVVKIWTYDES